MSHWTADEAMAFDELCHDIQDGTADVSAFPDEAPPSGPIPDDIAIMQCTLTDGRCLWRIKRYDFEDGDFQYRTFLNLPKI